MNEKILDALLGDPGTHMHCIGASGMGKTHFLHSLFRDAYYRDHGICIIDRNGKLFNFALNFLAFHYYKTRPIYIIDPSSGNWITPYNPFAVRTKNVSAAARRYVNTLVKSWHAQDTKGTPRVAEIAQLVFHFAIRAGITLPNAALLLHPEHDEVRQFALRLFDNAQDIEARDTLQRFMAKKGKGQDDESASTYRRLSLFTADEQMKRFLSYSDTHVSIERVLDENAILLVNLQHSDHLADDTATAFASLLLSDFFHFSMMRSGTDERFLLFLDEFQQFLSPDMASMLDEARNGGLRLVMAHQRLGQLQQKDFEDTLDAIMTNARVKAVFNVTSFQTSKLLAQQILLSELNRDVVKDEIWRYETVGHEVIELEREGSSISEQSYYDEEGDLVPSGVTETSDSGVTQQLLPILKLNPSSRTFYGVEEKLLKLTEKLMSMPERELVLNLPDTEPQMQRVEDVEPYLFSDENREAYVSDVMQNYAVSPKNADTHSLESRNQFLERVRHRPLPPRGGPPRLR